MQVADFVFYFHGSVDFQYDFTACAAFLKQGVGFRNLVKRKDTAVERLDVSFADKRKESVDGFACGEVREEARKENTVGNVLDRVEMLDREDIAQYARVADVSRMRYCQQ